MGGRAEPDHDGTHRGDTEHTTATMTAMTMTTTTITTRNMTAASMTIAAVTTARRVLGAGLCCRVRACRRGWP